MDFLKNDEVKTKEIMEKYHQEMDDKGFHEYSLNHIVNTNPNILTVQLMATMREKKSTTNNTSFQVQLAYICYINLHIHKPTQNDVLNFQKDHFSPKYFSKISNCLKRTI